MRRNCFSLIELLIVVGILGALSALILPTFSDTNKEAKKTVARAKMKDIQAAFGRFYGDLLNEMQTVDEESNKTLTNFYLQDIAENGLWPLFMRNHPYKTESSETQDWVSDKFRRYPGYSQTTGFGWHGPYIEQDDVIEIAVPNLLYRYEVNHDKLKVLECGGQTPLKEAGSSSNVKRKIPVIRDPYGGFFRVICPELRTAGQGGTDLSLDKRLRRMVIVCTGPNKRLDTATNNWLKKDDDHYIKMFNGDDVVAFGDDIVLRLLPTAR